MPKNKLYLIDATAFCYRAFYAITGLSTSFGQPTNAVYGFMNILNKILKDGKAEYMAACFDVSRNTFRARKFAEYKIQRPPMPDDLSSQIPLIKEIILAYGIPIFEKEGFEADDIIATLASRAKEKGFSTVIISSDKDILQLVDDDTAVFSPYKDEGVTYDRDKVRKRFGVEPDRIVDIIALMGDDADNIPGAPGIGEKTASALISRYGSLEELMKNADKIEQEKTRNIIKAHAGKINLSRELACLDKNVDIDFDADKLKIGKANYNELLRLFKYLEFKRFLKELPREAEGPQGVKSDELEDADLTSVLDPERELFLYGASPETLVFQIKDKRFRVKKAGVNLKAMLKDSSVRKISHDLKKIKIFLSREGIPLEGLYFDTMVAAYLLDPSKSGYDLNELAFDYLGISAGNILDESASLSLIAQLKPKLEEALREKSLSELFTGLEMPLVGVLARMEEAGVKLDLKVIKELSRDVEKRLIELIDEIYGISGSRFNINSPKQLRDILFERLKLPVVKRSKTGPSTDEEVLRKLSDKHRLPALLLEYRQLMKLKTTYIDTLPGLVDPKTGRLHTSFNQTGTETGRLSSSSPNLQNIPVKTEVGRNIRRAIIASGDEDYLVSCDYSQIELRILAHLAEDENLMLCFREGRDIHKITASLIYGLDEKDVTESMRDAAKRVNFGIIYGLTSYGLSRDLNIPLDEAGRFIDEYFLRYPGVQRYAESRIKNCRENGFVTTILGRRRYIPEINSKNQAIRQFAERQAVNTPIQGSASDMIKSAMVEIYGRLQSRGLKAKMVMQIHDELVFDVESRELEELVVLARERMENVLKLDVPIKVDIKKGKNWLEMEKIK